MDRAQYVETLRGRLSAAGLPVGTRRVQSLFEALLGCPPAEADQVAGLVNSVVATLTHPQRRKAMWDRMATISAAEWRKLAAQKACKEATRTRPRPQLAEGGEVPDLSPERAGKIATALLGVTPVAIQGSGHFQLELDQAQSEGLLSKESPCWELLQRLGVTLRAAERQHHVGVGPLVTLAGQALSVVTEHPDRAGELAQAAEDVAPAQLVQLAIQLEQERAAETVAMEKVIRDVNLVIVRAEDVQAIVARLTALDAVGWGEREQKTATRILLHLRQGESLNTNGAEADPAAARRTVRQGRARRRAADLLARLLVTRAKTEVWWARVVQVALREIELDSLGAKRIKASRQRSLAAKALEAVEQQASHTSGERRIEEEIAAELGRAWGELERELQQRLRDMRLRDRVNMAKVRLERFLIERPEAERPRLAQLAEEARQLAALGEMMNESGEWLFDMS